MQHHFHEQAIGKSKRDRTRAALLDSAIAVMAERGFDATTVRDIVRYAGLSQGTFYNHFADRESALTSAAGAILDRIDLRIAKRVRRMPTGCARLIVAADTIITAAVENPEHGAVLARAMARFPEIAARVRPKLRADIRAGQRAGTIHVAPSRLLDEQISAILRLAIKLRLAEHGRRTINRDTCEAVMRLLGQSPETSRKTVAAALQASP
ncbi:MAG: helix-turn-helix domain-containing protein [Pseudomonadota bacterium]